MKLILITIFYFLLGQPQVEVNDHIDDLNLKHRNGIFGGDEALFLYDNDVTYIFTFRDSICSEIGTYAPKTLYGDFQDECDSLFVRVSNKMFFGEGFRATFFKAENPDNFFMVLYFNDNDYE
jgi:hypothetical protein